MQNCIKLPLRLGSVPSHLGVSGGVCECASFNSLDPTPLPLLAIRIHKICCAKNGYRDVNVAATGLFFIACMQINVVISVRRLILSILYRYYNENKNKVVNHNKNGLVNDN